MAEMVLQAEFGAKHGIKFTMVRFGDVLGSSGSVVPIFRQQIERGSPVTVTHPDATRSFMSIPEAVQLILQAGAMGEGGDAFVLDMGEPVRIADLARNMIRLAGRTVRDADRPNGEIEVVFTGLRPGEKMFEELVIGAELGPTSHLSVMRARAGFAPWVSVETELQRLEAAVAQHDRPAVRALVSECIAAGSPSRSCRAWGSVRDAVAARDAQHGECEDPQVEADTGAVQVLAVERELPFVRQVVSAVDLRPAGDAGAQRVDASGFPGGDQIVLVVKRGAGSDEAHVAADDAPELGEFVEGECSQ